MIDARLTRDDAQQLLIDAEPRLRDRCGEGMWLIKETVSKGFLIVRHTGNLVWPVCQGDTPAEALANFPEYVELSDCPEAK
jgi:hypothetical protein